MSSSDGKYEIFYYRDMITGKRSIELYIWLDSLESCSNFYKACKNINLGIEEDLIQRNLMKDGKFLCSIEVPNRKCIKEILMPEFLRLNGQRESNRERKNERSGNKSSI